VRERPKVCGPRDGIVWRNANARFRKGQVLPKPKLPKLCWDEGLSIRFAADVLLIRGTFGIYAGC